MSVKVIACMLMLSALFLADARPASAGTGQTKQEAKAARIRTKIKRLGTGKDVRIKVELNNGAVYRGYLKETGEDGFVIVDTAGNDVTVKYADVDRIGGKNLSTGAKIAIGIAIGVVGTMVFLYIVAMTAFD